MKDNIKTSDFSLDTLHMLHSGSEVIESRSMFVRPVSTDINRTIFHPISDWAFYDSVRLSLDGQMRILVSNEDSVLERNIDGYMKLPDHNTVFLMIPNEDKIQLRILAPHVEMCGSATNPSVTFRTVQSRKDIEIQFSRSDQDYITVKNDNADIPIKQYSMNGHWLEEVYENATHIALADLPINEIASTILS